jgi:hypothetical protein
MNVNMYNCIKNIPDALDYRLESHVYWLTPLHSFWEK